MTSTHETPKEAARRLSASAMSEGFEPQALHEYADGSGRPLHWRIRAKNPDTGEKWIRPMKLNGAGYVLGEPDYLHGKPIYRLPELTDRSKERVYLVEGELCVDALAKIGVLATTSGAADSADKADWQPLKGREVVIWPDNDDAGFRYGATVAAALVALDCTVRWVEIARLELPPKGDVVDWLNLHEGATSADINALPTQENSPTLALAAASTVRGANTWPLPKPIVAELKPVPPFNADTLLPEALRAWVVDEAERMPCPPEFIATAVVVALGSITGARVAIKPKARDSWLIVPNLWGGIVGDPSAKKSPAWGVALKPLDRLIAKAREEHQAALGEYETAKVVFNAQKDAIEGRIKEAAKKPSKGDPTVIARELRTHGEQAPDAPTPRRYKTNDSTVEKLGELLRENPAGLLVLRDELVGLIAAWEREGREGDRAFFLEAWNGNQSFDTDRIGRGHISISNLCASIFGGIQPDKLTVYLEQAAHALANDGMLQRFQLLVYPDPRRWEWRDRQPNKAARDVASAVFEKLAQLDPVACGAEPADDVLKFPWFCFDDEAQAVFIKWSEDMHQRRIPKEEDPIIRQHLAKYDKLFPALALIFHLVEGASDGDYGPVGKPAATRAAAWCEFLEAHARRCYGLLKDDGLRAAQALATKLERGALKDGFSLRDVRRNQWRSLTTDDAIRSALDWLEDEDWLQSESSGGTGSGSGRRTVRYLINPVIMDKWQNRIR